MSKLTLLSFILIVTMVLIVPQVQAEDDNSLALPNRQANTTPGAKLTDKVEKVIDQYEKRMDKLQEKVEVAKQKVVEKVRVAVGSRWEAYNRILAKEEIMLNKLQLRIDRAKEAGVNVSNMEKLMADSRAKLTDAKNRLSTLSSQKETAIDKKQFEAVRTELKAIWQDIKTIKENSSKIIRELKAFNRSANAPLPKATASAKISPTKVSSPAANAQ